MVLERREFLLGTFDNGHLRIFSNNVDLLFGIVRHFNQREKEMEA